MSAEEAIPQRLIIDGGGAEEGEKMLGAVIGDVVGSRFELH